MSLRWRIALAMVILAVGIPLILWANQKSDHQSAQDRREHCLYALIEQFPDMTFDDSSQATDALPECKSLPAADKRKVGAMVITFVEDAINRMNG